MGRTRMEAERMGNGAPAHHGKLSRLDGPVYILPEACGQGCRLKNTGQMGR